MNGGTVPPGIIGGAPICTARPIREAPDALAALDALAGHVTRFHGRALPLIRAADQARRTDPDVEHLWQTAMSAWYGACEGLIARLVAEDRLAPAWDAKTAADMLWALMSVELIEDLVHDRGWSEELYAERLGLLMRRALTR